MKLMSLYTVAVKAPKREDRIITIVVADESWKEIQDTIQDYYGADAAFRVVRMEDFWV